MADILLQKPAAGQVTTLTPQAEDRLVFEFDSAEATLTRDGDNLVMSFEDGASLSLTDFYVAYTSENMPTFLIAGSEVDGQSFFATLGEELMPAAGPNTGTPQGSGSGVDTLAGTLLGGIDRLGRLDQDYPNTIGQNEIPEDEGSAVGPLNTSPSILGILVNPDPDSSESPDTSLGTPDAFPGTVDVIESGVGREANGADSSHSSPNQAYGGEFNATGRVLATDDDADTLTFSVQNGMGQYGSLTINPTTGEFGYTFDDAKANGLAHNQLVTESFTIMVSDGNGGTATTTINVTIRGTNDKPTLEIAKGDAALTLSQDDTNISGQAIGADVDAGDTFTYSVSASHVSDSLVDASGNIPATAGNTASGLYGALKIDAITGEFTYEFYGSHAENALDDNESHTEKFTVYVKDQNNAWTPQEITVTVTGKNDAPEILVNGKNLAVVEAGVRDDLNTSTVDHNEAFAGTPTANGTITAWDADGDALTFTAKADNATYDNYGSFSIDIHGNYTFTLNNAEDSAADKLRDGETVVLKYTVTISDGDAQTQQTIEVTITGTNDKPELTLTPTDSFVKEDNTPHDTSDDNLTATGRWDTNDIDNDGNIQTITADDGNGIIAIDAQGVMSGSVTVEGIYGNLVIHDNGSYTYTLGVTNAQKSAVDALGDADSKEENFTITTTDKYGAYDSKNLTITVNGTNDVPHIVSPNGENSFVTTDDSELEHGTEYDKNAHITRSNTIEFTSVESMNGGKITLDLGFDTDGDGINDSQEFAIIQNTDGTWSLSPESITVTGQYGEFTFDMSGPVNASTGSFTLNYTYTQTKPYLDHAVTNSDNELEKNAESLKVVIQDSNDSASQGLHTNITVHINDDGPTVTTAWTDTDTSDGNDITVNLGTGTAINQVELFSFEYGADQEGATLTFSANSPFSIVNDTEVWHDGQKIGDIVVDGNNVNFTFNMSVSGAPVDTPYIPDGIIPNIEFSYTITDGDKDSESGNVTVDVKNLEFQITGSSVIIDDADTTSYTQTGSIDINGYDDVNSVTIGGQMVSFKDGDLNGEQVLVFEGYTVTVTGFDKESGQLTYEVSIDKAYIHTNTHDSDHEDDITTSYNDENKDGNVDINIKLDITVNGGTSKNQPSLDITILDDAPEAKNDTDDTADADGSYTGNIFTGEGTKEGTENADIIGADDWENVPTKLESTHVTPPATGGWVAATTVPLGFDFGFEDDYGNTIFFDKDGNYTFTPGEHLVAGENNFTFGYTITDGDKDSDSATLTVTIHTPVIEEPKEPTEDDSTVTKINLLTDDSDLSTNATGQIIFTSKDTMDGGKITIGGQEFTVTLNEHGEYVLSTTAENGFTLEDGIAGQLLVSPELGYDASTGEFTLSFEYDQTQAYTGEKHDDNVSENAYDETAHGVVSFDVLIQDGKEAPNATLGDSTSITVDIKDDGPMIRDTLQSAIQDSYTLDKNNSEEDTDYNHSIWAKEMHMGSIAKQELASLFDLNLIKEHVDFGADEAAKDASITVTEHSLVMKDTATYDLTSGGEKVTIYQEGGKIYGFIGQGENKEIVFEVYLDDAGAVCLKQNLPLDHADGTKINAESGINEDHYLELKDVIDVKATITITDGDGDTAKTEVTSGLTLNFQDDAPLIVGDEAYGTAGHGQTSSTLVDGKAFAQVEVDFGADGPGKILLKNGATYELGVAWIVDENGVGTWKEIQAPEWETSPTIVYYSYEDGIHKVVMGDITITSTDNQNWDMVFDADREDINLGFVDGDEDEIKHTVKALEHEDYALEPNTRSIMPSTENDELRGGSGNDSLFGSDDNDIIYGGAGEDSLFGGSGDDIIYFDFSDVEIKGGSGNDLFVLQDCLENVELADLFSIHGGEDDAKSIDVLLSGLHSVKELQDLFAKGSTTVSNMEVIMLGDDMKAAQDLQQSLMTDKNTALNGWNKTEPVNIDGKEYQEYISDDHKLTVLIESHLLTNS